MTNPKEVTKDFIKKQVQIERDKWSSGMKNSYYAWEDFLTEYEIKILGEK